MEKVVFDYLTDGNGGFSIFAPGNSTIYLLITPLTNPSLRYIKTVEVYNENLNVEIRSSKKTYI